jgi:hypothetical protein
MSYQTFEVEIDHGRIIAKDSVTLPAKGSALLTILTAQSEPTKAPRPHGLAKGQFVTPEDFNSALGFHM